MMLVSLVNWIFWYAPARLFNTTSTGPPWGPKIVGTEVVFPLRLARVFIDDVDVLDWNTHGIEFALGKLIQIGFHHYEGYDRPCIGRVFVHLLGRRYSYDVVTDWVKAIGKWKDVSFKQENYEVEFLYIGEGLTGDFDPNNPDDYPHVRFYCSRWNPSGTTTIQRTDGSEGSFGGSWDEVDSYCTAISVKASYEVLERAADSIVEAMKSSWSKRRLEEMSSLCEEEIEHVLIMEKMDSLLKREGIR